jgi:hypothetical protein
MSKKWDVCHPPLAISIGGKGKQETLPIFDTFSASMKLCCRTAYREVGVATGELNYVVESGALKIIRTT